MHGVCFISIMWAYRYFQDKLESTLESLRLLRILRSGHLHFGCRHELFNAR